VIPRIAGKKVIRICFPLFRYCSLVSLSFCGAQCARRHTTILTPSNNPNDLAFGALSAERDFNEGLRAYFVESESYKRLRDGKTAVALGNRGSGKTAIFKMIGNHHRGSGAYVVELSPEDYSYELLAQTMLAEEKGSWAKHGAYAAAWKFLLYVLAMKAVTKGGGLKTGEAKQIYDYLRDNHRDPTISPLALLVSYLKRLEGIKIGKYEASAKARELQSLYKLEQLEPLLDALNNICAQRRVYLLVDELDRGWDASEDAVAFVAGLFQAAMAINARTPNIHILISLRRELYENIPALYEDAQKVRDVMEIIEWDEPALLELVAKRIAHSLPVTANQTASERWNAVFVETLGYRQNKSFNYMVDRTLYRPRELIQFCLTVRNSAISRKDRLPLDYSTISEAEHTYSEERTKDIAAEYRFQYPGLSSVFETFRGTNYTLERQELELHCLQVITGEFKVAAEASWALQMEPDTMIEALWRVGFLRAQAVGGVKARRRSGSSYLGSHQISSLSLSNINRFHIHPMFRSALGLRETKRPSHEDE
jgi:hypothetical protein